MLYKLAQITSLEEAMPQPQDVQHSRFVVQQVVFDDSKFSIVWGTYDGHPSIGMRWNGNDGMGYPTARGRPVWFLVAKDIEQSLLGGLAAALPKGTNVDALAAVVKIRGV